VAVVNGPSRARAREHLREQLRASSETSCLVSAVFSGVVMSFRRGTPDSADHWKPATTALTEVECFAALATLRCGQQHERAHPALAGLAEVTSRIRASSRSPGAPRGTAF
jgi:hypothetical protein